MKVALVSEHASPLAVLGGVDAGGQNVHVAALATELARLGVEVVVYTRRDSPDVPERVTMVPGVHVHHVDAGPAAPIPKDDLLPHMDEFGRVLSREWGESPPDIVHSHFWMSGKAALGPAQKHGIPAVQTFHALGVVKQRNQGARDTSPSARLDIERALVKRTDHIIATCSDEVFELLRLGAEWSRVTVVPCGVDLRLFRPDGARDQRKPGMQRVLVVSRLVERKGIGNVVTALADLPGVELVIAGGPPRAQLWDDAEARRLRALAEATGVADRVEFRGNVERANLPALYRSADVVACVPWYEPFGIVPLEAMACGVPVVASAVGGLTDTVVDGITGVHVPPRRPEQVSEALAGLLADRARRAELGRTGARRTRARYGWGRVAKATLDVYTSLAVGVAVGARA